ncbi:MAG: hypothetical protein Q4G16_09150 [Cruoricaptor ignavus]|nr:hypothetical protein [Cruoricaptor ignavus]
MKFKNLFAALAMLLLVSCNTDNPENYFDKTTLVTNQTVPFDGNFINKMQQDKNLGRLQIIENNEVKNTESAVEYLQKYIIPEMQKSIDKVEALKVTDDTKGMIESSLDLLKYAKTVKETDYVNIAKMMDEGKPQAEIDATANAILEKTTPVIEEKYNKLLEHALPYAEKNGIEVK